MAKEIINSWKINKYPVSADAAKAEFDRIYDKYGEITTKAVVDESRDDCSVLHSCFEWDDSIAAEKYRQTQAGEMIRLLVTIEKSDEEAEPMVVRAIVKTTEKYEPITVTVRSEEKYAVLLQDALNDAMWFKKKYENLKELRAVIDAIDEFASKLKVG